MGILEVVGLYLAVYAVIMYLICWKLPKRE